jgi:carboxymethylenebutenolidase
MDDELKRYLIDEIVEDYEHGRLTRRDALATLAGLTGAALGAQLLAACGKREPATTGTASASGSASSAPALPGPPQSPDSVRADDPAIVAAWVQFPGDGGATLRGYLARPAREGRFPIVLVCHENRGLGEHIQDVTRRAGKVGYVALAVDLLSREGGSERIRYEDVPGVLGKASPERHVGDFRAGLLHARAQAFANAERAGMVGFCFGGGVTWRVAAGVPELRAVAPFYGMPVEPDKVGTIAAAVLAICAEKDERVNGALPAVEAAMQQQGKTIKKIVYPGTQHAFHNDTGGRYVQAAAQKAWAETMAWFAKYLA